MKKTMTLEKLLTRTRDCVLLDIYLEIQSGVVPATGCAHTYVRKINRMIDRGALCINQSTYRKVYLPSLAKAVQKEMANRYTNQLLQKMTQTDSCEQIALDLVSMTEQVEIGE